MSELSFIHWKVLVERDCVFQFYMIHHPPLISSKLLTPRTGDVYCIEVRPLMNWFIANINRCSQISSKILRCFHISSIMLSATQIKTIPSIDSLQFQVQTFSGKSRKLSTGKLIETFFPALTWQLFAVCRSCSRFRTELKTVFLHFSARVAHCV